MVHTNAGSTQGQQLLKYLLQKFLEKYLTESIKKILVMLLGASNDNLLSIRSSSSLQITA